MPENEEKLDFENMDDEQLLDKFSDDPKGFITLVAGQVKKDIERENEQKAEDDRYIRTYQDFVRENPDFETMWESGKIKEFMDSHAGHNALSAYLSLSHESRIQKAVAKKLQEKGLGGDGPLSDTKKYGGTTWVLANRLRALRSQGGGKRPPAGETESGDLKPTM
jgi:hypothetical protein